MNEKEIPAKYRKSEADQIRDAKTAVKQLCAMVTKMDADEKHSAKVIEAQSATIIADAQQHAAEIAELNRKLSLRGGMIDNRNALLETCTGWLREHEANRERMEGENAELRRKVEKLQSSNGQLNERITRMKGPYSSSTDEVFIKHMEVRQDNVLSQGKKIASLERNLRLAEHERDTANEEVTRRARTIERLERERGVANDEVTRLKGLLAKSAEVPRVKTKGEWEGCNPKAPPYAAPDGKEWVSRLSPPYWHLSDASPTAVDAPMQPHVTEAERRERRKQRQDAWLDQQPGVNDPLRYDDGSATQHSTIEKCLNELKRSARMPCVSQKVPFGERMKEDNMPFLPQKPEDKTGWKQPEQCLSPEHLPPNMIVLPPGRHTWVCPVCGKKTVVGSNQMTW